MNDTPTNENLPDDNLKPETENLNTESVNSGPNMNESSGDAINSSAGETLLTEKETEEERASRFQEFFNDTVETNHPKMTDSLLVFIELKEIDEELAEIDEVKGDLPDSIKATRTRAETVGEELAEKKTFS